MTREEFSERQYREEAVPAGLVSFRATVGETDLWIAARRDLTEEALKSIRAHRRAVEEYIAAHPEFVTALGRWPESVPAGSIVARMVDAGNAVGIGPMAAVAGSIAEAVARDLVVFSSRILVENGGDLFLAGGGARTVGVWAGTSPLSGRFGLSVEPGGGIAICTSSGTVGPSLSFGRADAAVVVSPSGALADAAATELGNRVKAPGDIETALDWATSVAGVLGAVVVMGEVIGAKGQVELVPLRHE